MHSNRVSVKNPLESIPAFQKKLLFVHLAYLVELCRLLPLSHRFSLTKTLLPVKLNVAALLDDFSNEVLETDKSQLTHFNKRYIANINTIQTLRERITKKVMFSSTDYLRLSKAYDKEIYQHTEIIEKLLRAKKITKPAVDHFMQELSQKISRFNQQILENGKVLEKAKNELHTLAGISINNLPNEILELIASQLDTVSLLQLRSVSTRFNRIIKADSLWRPRVENPTNCFLGFLQNQRKPDYNFKICLLGDKNEGKEALLSAYLGNNTKLVDNKIYRKTIEIDNRKIELNLFIYYLRTFERYECLQKTDGVILCVDLSASESVENFVALFRQIQDASANKLQVFGVATKNDVKAVSLIDMPKLKDLIQEMCKAPALFTSAKTNEGVALCFQSIAAHILSKQPLYQLEKAIASELRAKQEKSQRLEETTCTASP